jgi:hypothetical protein
MRYPTIVAAACVLAGVTLAEPLAAGEGDGLGLAWHGFVSQSFLKTNDNVYLGLNSTAGTFAYTEEAINGTINPTAKLRIGIQLIGRDLGPQGNHKITADWALADYHWKDEIGVRAGKIKLPVGLYNTVFDVDVARPDILQPDGIYPQNQHDFRNTFEGVQLYGTVKLGGAGYLDYEAWTGTIDIDEAFVLPRFLSDGALALLPAFAASGISNPSYQVNQTGGRLDTSFGGTLEWRPPVAGLRLKASLAEADAFFNSAVTYSGSFGPAPVSFPVRTSIHIDQRYTLYLSGEYQRAGLRLSAEHLRGDALYTTNIDGLPGQGTITTSFTNQIRATYAQVAYRFTPRLQASAYYSVYYPDAQDKEGRALVLAGQPSHRAWQKDFTVTGRVDIDSHFLVKAELHLIDGTAALSTSDNPGGFQKDWKLFTARATFHF